MGIFGSGPLKYADYLIITYGMNICTYQKPPIAMLLTMVSLNVLIVIMIYAVINLSIMQPTTILL